jgi:hypothetical protein
MNSKDNPLRKAGYDYGDTLWGTGEGWGYWSPVNIQLNLKKRTIKKLFFSPISLGMLQLVVVVVIQIILI